MYRFLLVIQQSLVTVPGFNLHLVGKEESALKNTETQVPKKKKKKNTETQQQPVEFRRKEEKSIKMGEIKIEVNKVAGGGGAWINWKREVHIRKETTHPYEVRVGAYLALKEGEEGMKRLQKDGKKTRQQLEQELENRYMKGVLGKPGVCKNPGAMSV